MKSRISLYAITDEYLTPDETVIQQVKESLEAGIDILQYRNKTKSDDEVKTICIELQKLCTRYKVPFIIDDRPYLAQEIGADGLHIGKDDMPLVKAREIFKDGIIGVSCYGSVKKAQEAQEEGASYVAFGSFFPSPTKPHSGIVSRSVIQKAKDILDIPVCVIGGISHTNIQEIIKEKPDMISLVSAVYSGCITSNVKNIKKEMQGYKGDNFKKFRVDANFAKLVDFHRINKFMLQSKDENIYRKLGKIVGNHEQKEFSSILDEYEYLYKKAISTKSSVGKRRNALEHMAGFLKKFISTEEKALLHKHISDYADGVVSIVIPLDTLNKYARKYDVSYLLEQTFLNPYSKELGLNSNADS